MATQETQLQLLIGQGDSDSDIGRPARARPVHLRLVEEPPTRWARLRARGWPATHAAGGWPHPNTLPPTCGGHSQPAGGAEVPLQRAGLGTTPGTAGPPHTRDHDQREDHPCSTVERLPT